MNTAEVIDITEQTPKISARQMTILEAAARVFTEKGFDVATMQDVAQACDMSPGNLYRYFPSKAAIIMGLIELDRQESAAAFEKLAGAENQVEGFEEQGRIHLKHECHKTAKLTLQIWAAASRQPELRTMCEPMESGIVEHLHTFVNRAVADGSASPNADPDIVVHVIMAMARSLFHDAALNKDHDIDRDLDIMFATVRAALAGHIQIKKQNTQKGIV